MNNARWYSIYIQYTIQSVKKEWNIRDTHALVIFSIIQVFHCLVFVTTLRFYYTSDIWRVFWSVRNFSSDMMLPFPTISIIRKVFVAFSHMLFGRRKLHLRGFFLMRSTSKIMNKCNKTSICDVMMHPLCMSLYVICIRISYAYK